jgi:hypothetical protein
MSIEQLPWLIELPANSGTTTDYIVDIAPVMRGVRAVHATGWHLKASVMPARVKVEFDSDVGNRRNGFFSLGVASYTANPTATLNNGLLITPNTTLQEDRQEYQVPRKLVDLASEQLGALRVRVTDFTGGAVVHDGPLWIELMLTIDLAARPYLTPDQYSTPQRQALDSYFISSGQRPRQHF